MPCCEFYYLYISLSLFVSFSLSLSLFLSVSLSLSLFLSLSLPRPLSLSPSPTLDLWLSLPLSLFLSLYYCLSLSFSFSLCLYITPSLSLLQILSLSLIWFKTIIFPVAQPFVGTLYNITSRNLTAISCTIDFQSDGFAVSWRKGGSRRSFYKSLQNLKKTSWYSCCSVGRSDKKVFTIET